MSRFHLFILFLLMGPISSLGAPQPEERLDDKIIKKNIEIRNKIDDVAKSVDKALTGKDAIDQENKTKITIRNQINWGEGGNFLYTPHLDLKLHLPNLERKWLLKFSTYDEDQESRGVNKNRLKTTPIRGGDYGGGVGIFQKLGQINAEFQPRIEFRGQPQLSYILRLTSQGKSENIIINPEMQFFARTDSGIGQFIGLDADIPLFSTFVFTLINEEQYLDRENNFSTNNGTRLGWEYSDYVGQNISIMFESSSRPNYHLDRYTVATAVTHKIWKEVFHYTIQPYFAFPRNLDFKGSPGVNLEILFIF